MLWAHNRTALRSLIEEHFVTEEEDFSAFCLDTFADDAGALVESRSTPTLIAAALTPDGSNTMLGRLLSWGSRRALGRLLFRLASIMKSGKTRCVASMRCTLAVTGGEMSVGAAKMNPVMQYSLLPTWSNQEPSPPGLVRLPFLTPTVELA